MTLQQLETLKNDLVEKYFDDQESLKNIPISVNFKLTRSLGRYCYRTNQSTRKPYEKKIELSTKTVFEYPQILESVLVHELVHAWQHEVCGATYHDYTFNKKANEIERMSNFTIKDIVGRSMDLSKEIPDAVYVAAKREAAAKKAVKRATTPHVKRVQTQQWAVKNQQNQIEFLRRLSATDRIYIRSKGYSLYENKADILNVTHAKSVEHLFGRKFYRDNTGSINIAKNFEAIFEQ